MAVDPHHRDMKLIPWGGVAALLSHIRQTAAVHPLVDGLAFCFLPLPVHTQLPVHVRSRRLLGGRDCAGALFPSPPPSLSCPSSPSKWH
jgi:hypothetical protein